MYDDLYNSCITQTLYGDIALFLLSMKFTVEFVMLVIIQTCICTNRTIELVCNWNEHNNKSSCGIESSYRLWVYCRALKMGYSCNWNDQSLLDVTWNEVHLWYYCNSKIYVLGFVRYEKQTYLQGNMPQNNET